jgi:hypothetical protein
MLLGGLKAIIRRKIPESAHREMFCEMLSLASSTEMEGKQVAKAKAETTAYNANVKEPARKIASNLEFRALSGGVIFEKTEGEALIEKAIINDPGMKRIFQEYNEAKKNLEHRQREVVHIELKQHS